MAKQSKFRRGYIAGFSEIERAFFLSFVGKVSPKTDLERRMLARFVQRMSGNRVTTKLRERKPCPHCEREVLYIERHVSTCLENPKNMPKLPKIDPAVWEMMR